MIFQFVMYTFTRPGIGWDAVEVDPCRRDARKECEAMYPNDMGLLVASSLLVLSTFVLFEQFSRISFHFLLSTWINMVSFGSKWSVRLGEVISKTRGASEVGSIRSITTDIEAWPLMVLKNGTGITYTYIYYINSIYIYTYIYSIYLNILIYIYIYIKIVYIHIHSYMTDV